MKNLKHLLLRAIQECNAVGIKTGKIVDITVNTRAKRWGQARRLPNGTYTININANLVRDSVSDKAIMDTLVHEVLHTCEGCMNHGARWKYYATIMNRAYGYNIKRCTSAEEKGLNTSAQISSANYAIKCESCGHVYTYQRAGKAVQLIRNYGYNSGCRCACGSRKLVLL